METPCYPLQLTNDWFSVRISVDIDKHTNGRVLIGSGVGFLTGSAIATGFSPLILKWAYSDEGLTGWIFPGVVVPFADVGLCAAGIAAPPVLLTPTLN